MSRRHLRQQILMLLKVLMSSVDARIDDGPDNSFAGSTEDLSLRCGPRLAGEHCLRYSNCRILEIARCFLRTFACSRFVYIMPRRALFLQFSSNTLMISRLNN